MQHSLFKDISTPHPTQYQPDLMDDDISYQETETMLESYLEYELTQFTPLILEPVTDSPLHSKYAYSSAMQKSIRRGHVENSIRYASAYHSIDPTGFWVRLPVIALEDVALGNPIGVALCLAASRSKVFRSRVGGDKKVIQFIVAMLSRAIKDRSSCCDFMQILWHHPRKFKDMTALKTATTQELTAFSLSESNTTAFRTCAAWLLVGTDRFECKTLPIRPGSREQFCSMVSQMPIPSLVKYVTMRGAICCRFPMWLMFPFMWMKKEKSLFISVEKSDLPSESTYIAGLPDFTFDQYTREGKQSFGSFAKSCSEVNQFLTAKDITGLDGMKKAIGCAVFISEGALLDRRLDFEGVNEITATVEQIDYQNAGLSLSDGRTLAGLIEANSDILRQSRIRVVAGARG